MSSSTPLSTFGSFLPSSVDDLDDDLLLLFVGILGRDQLAFIAECLGKQVSEIEQWYAKKFKGSRPYHKLRSYQREEAHQRAKTLLIKLCSTLLEPEPGGQPARAQPQTKALRAQYLIGDLPAQMLLALLCQVHGIQTVVSAADLHILLEDAADENLSTAPRNMSGVSDEDMMDANSTAPAATEASSPFAPTRAQLTSALLMQHAQLQQQNQPYGRPPIHPPSTSVVRQVPPPATPDQALHLPPAVPVFAPSNLHSATTTATNSPEDNAHLPQAYDQAYQGSSSRRGSRAATPPRQPRSTQDAEGGHSPKTCTNCRTVHTPLWRKEAGMLMCNACGIYFKNHGYHRPMELVRAGVRREQAGAPPGAHVPWGVSPAYSSEPSEAGGEGGGAYHVDTAISPPHRRRRSSNAGSIATNNTIPSQVLDLSALTLNHASLQQLTHPQAAAPAQSSKGGYSSRAASDAGYESGSDAGVQGGTSGAQPARRSGRRRTAKHYASADWVAEGKEQQPGEEHQASRRRTSSTTGNASGMSTAPQALQGPTTSTVAAPALPTHGKRSRFGDQHYREHPASVPGSHYSGSELGDEEHDHIRRITEEVPAHPGNFSFGEAGAESLPPGHPLHPHPQHTRAPTPRLPSGPVSMEVFEAAAAAEAAMSQKPTQPPMSDSSQAGMADSMGGEGEEDLTVADDASQVATVLMGLKRSLALHDALPGAHNRHATGKALEGMRGYASAGPSGRSPWSRSPLRGPSPARGPAPPSPLHPPQNPNSSQGAAEGIALEGGGGVSVGGEGAKARKDYHSAHGTSSLHDGDRGYSSGPEYGKWGGVGGQSVGVNKRRPRHGSGAGSWRGTGARTGALSEGGGAPGAGGSQNVCANCGTSKTPLWRKDKDTGATMCNACGIYKQTHGFARNVDAGGMAIRGGGSHAGDEGGRGISPAQRRQKQKAKQQGLPPGQHALVQQLQQQQQQQQQRQQQQASQGLGAGGLNTLPGLESLPRPQDPYLTQGLQQLLQHYQQGPQSSVLQLPLQFSQQQQQQYQQGVSSAPYVPGAPAPTAAIPLHLASPATLVAAGLEHARPGGQKRVSTGSASSTGMHSTQQPPSGKPPLPPRSTSSSTQHTPRDRGGDLYETPGGTPETSTPPSHAQQPFAPNSGLASSPSHPLQQQQQQQQLFMCGSDTGVGGPLPVKAEQSMEASLHPQTQQHAHGLNGFGSIVQMAEASQGMEAPDVKPAQSQPQQQVDLQLVQQQAQAQQQQAQQQGPAAARGTGAATQPAPAGQVPDVPLKASGTSVHAIGVPAAPLSSAGILTASQPAGMVMPCPIPLFSKLKPSQPGSPWLPSSGHDSGAASPEASGGPGSANSPPRQPLHMQHPPQPPTYPHQPHRMANTTHGVAAPSGGAPPHQPMPPNQALAALTQLQQQQQQQQWAGGGPLRPPTGSQDSTSVPGIPAWVLPPNTPSQWGSSAAFHQQLAALAHQQQQQQARVLGGGMVAGVPAPGFPVQPQLGMPHTPLQQAGQQLPPNPTLAQLLQPPAGQQQR